MLCEMAKNRTRYRTGAVVVIPLPDGRYGYGRLYKNLTIGLFRVVSDELLPLADIVRRPIGPILTFHDEAVEDGRWPIIGHFPFASDDEAWGPPSRGVGDSLWVRGWMVIPTTAQEKRQLRRLEDHYLRDPAEIIRRVYEANRLTPPKGVRRPPRQVAAPPNDPWADFAVLFQNDTASLVKDRYEEAGEEGATIAQACRTVLSEFQAELEDEDDRPRVLFPVAVLQLLGRKTVDAKLREQVLALLADPAVHREYPIGTSDRKAVKNALRKLEARLKGGK